MKKRPVSRLDHKDQRLAELELELTRLESRLRRSEQLRTELEIVRDRSEELYELGTVGHLTLGPKAEIQFLNRTMARFLGYEPQEMIARPLLYFVFPGDTQRFLTHLRNCRQYEGRTITSNLRLRMSTGEPISVRFTTRPCRSSQGLILETVVFDQSERVRSLAALKEATEFAEAIVRTMHEPLVVLDRHLRITSSNAAFESLFGTSARIVYMFALDNLLSFVGGKNVLRARLEQALQNGTPLRNFELEARLRTGGRHVFRFNARRLPGKEDSQPFLLVAFEDVTAQKEAEQELAKSNARLKKLNEELEARVQARTQALTESNAQLESFCYSIAHDLREPARAIVGFATALGTETGPAAAADKKHFVERILAAGQRMQRLIDDLLAYGRLTTVEFSLKSVKVDDVLNEVLESLEADIQATKAAIIRKTALGKAQSHPTLLQAVFSNLLTNAIKFVPRDVKPEVTIWAERSGKFSRIWFADNGIGIEPRHQQRIFELFQRLHTQAAYPGTGLGLAIVQKAVTRMGGQVGVESAPGHGSRFWVELPRG